MEEIITLDGRQFKLTVDRPLTATEKAQVLADIRKQTGCTSGCGQRTMGSDWQYGGQISSLAVTCTRTTVTSAPGNPVSLSASPNLGTAPYTVRFLGQFSATPALLTGAGLTGTAQQTVATDGGTTTAVTYQVSDAEIVTAGPSQPSVANVDGSGISIPAKAANTIRFLNHTADSCPTVALHCLEWCDLAIVCPTPTCNFTVS